MDVTSCPGNCECVRLHEEANELTGHSGGDSRPWHGPSSDAPAGTAGLQGEALALLGQHREDGGRMCVTCCHSTLGSDRKGGEIRLES